MLVFLFHNIPFFLNAEFVILKQFSFILVFPFGFSTALNTAFLILLVFLLCFLKRLLCLWNVSHALDIIVGIGSRILTSESDRGSLHFFWNMLELD